MLNKAGGGGTNLGRMLNKAGGGTDLGRMLKKAGGVLILGGCVPCVIVPFVQYSLLLAAWNKV